MTCRYSTRTAKLVREYPNYHSWGDWLRLYLIIYPIGGMSVLELIYFLAGLFKEKLTLIHSPTSAGHIIDKLDFLLDVTLLLIILVYFFSKLLYPIPYLRLLFVLLLLLWMLVATIKFKYHIKHWSHWLVIFFVTLFMYLFLNEIPNTRVYEWRYYNAPIFNQSILDIPLWVFFGWYCLILLMLRVWTYLILERRRDKKINLE